MLIYIDSNLLNSSIPTPKISVVKQKSGGYKIEVLKDRKDRSCSLLKRLFQSLPFSSSHPSAVCKFFNNEKTIKVLKKSLEKLDENKKNHFIENIQNYNEQLRQRKQTSLFFSMLLPEIKPNVIASISGQIPKEKSPLLTHPLPSSGSSRSPQVDKNKQSLEEIASLGSDLAFNDELPLSLIPVLPNGINMGLPNLDNSCWLNASLKYLAMNPTYDSMLDPNPSADKDPKWNTLRSSLKEVIWALRQQTTFSQLDLGLYNKLMKSIEECFPNQGFEKEQQDPSDFLSRLMGRLDFPRKNISEEVKNSFFMTTVCELTNSPRWGTRENVTPCMDVIFTSKDLKEENHPVNIGEIFTQGEIEGGKKRDLPIYLPENLDVSISRAILDDRGGSKKCARPLAFENGHLTLYEYAQNNGKMLPIKAVTYQVVGAICHWDSKRSVGSIDSGHYVAYERDQNGEVWLHNDDKKQKIKPQQKEEVWKNASRLYLKKVREKSLEN